MAESERTRRRVRRLAVGASVWTARSAAGLRWIDGPGASCGVVRHGHAGEVVGLPYRAEDGIFVVPIRFDGVLGAKLVPVSAVVDSIDRAQWETATEI